MIKKLLPQGDGRADARCCGGTCRYRPGPVRPSAGGTPPHKGGTCSWIVASLTSWTPKLKQMGVHETGATSFLLAAGFLGRLCGCLAGHLGNQEILGLGALRNRLTQPHRLSAAAGPLVSGLVAILGRHLATFQRLTFSFSMNGNTSNFGKIVSERRELLS